MKKIISILMSIVIVFLSMPFLSISVSALGKYDGDYTYRIVDGTAVLTSYQGEGGHIIIPATLGGYQVTHIRAEAFTFWYCDTETILSVTIPEGVVSIGEDCFSGCNNLKNIYLPNSIRTLERGALGACGIESISIPTGVTYINDYMFINCSNLKEVNIPNTVTEIGEGVFWSCSSITEITLPENLIGIGRYAFWGCDSLKEITIPKNIKNINSCTFQACSGLEKVFLPNGLLTINDNAFDGCLKLSEISFPNELLSIGAKSFLDCQRLSSITIPDSVSSIGYSAFSNCSSLENINLSRNINKLENTTFKGCSNLSNIVIPDNVKEIGNGVFSDCTKLISVEIPSTTTVIGRETFRNCSSLQTIIIPNGVTILNEYIFNGCTNLRNVVIGENVLEISKGAFQNCSNLDKIDLPDGITLIGDNAFENCTSLSHVKFNTKLKTLGNSSFANCKKLEELGLSNEVISIGNKAFYECNSLKKINLSNKLVSIGDYAFYNCDNLSDLKIPNTVKTIGNRAFYWCDELANVTMTNSVVSIGEFAFYWCDKLEEIKILYPLCRIGDNAIDRDTKIYGYKGSTSEEYAKKNGNEFFELNITDTYYSNYNGYIFNVCDDKGSLLKDSVLSFNGQEYIVNSSMTRIAVPDGYNGDITISKPGYITVTRSAKDLKDFNFVTLYPESVTRPITQQLNLYNQNNNSTYTDLLRGYEYIYDLGGEQYDLYLDVCTNGNTISSMYLIQNDKKITLQNGINKDVPINGTFNSEGGTIFFCILTSNGTVYKMDSHIVARKTQLEFSMNDMGSMSGKIDESIDAVGGGSFSANLKLGDLPVKIQIEDGGTFKGTIGIESSESTTATFYDTIKSTIIKHSSNGNDEFPSLEMAKLDKYIKNAGGEFVESSSSFGIDVKAKIVGYVEGSINPFTGEIENLETNCLMSIGGELSYTQQSIAYVVPYYWKVKFETNLSMLLKAVWMSEDKEANKIPFEWPGITLKIGIGGELCAGINKIAGGGARLTGEVEAKFSEPYYDFESSVWTLTLDFALIGQVAGFESSFTPFGDHLVDYQIYPDSNSYSVRRLSNNFIANSRILSRNYLNEHSIFSLNADDNVNNIIKTNTYTYTAPQAAQLENGNILLVWLDDDNDRADINRTALYYSIYDSASQKWSEPLQIEDDGTPDFSPVLKVLDGTPYLLWTDCSNALSENADMNSVLADMDISFAEFNGTSFEGITNISGANGVMDALADIILINETPTIVWASNDANDIFFTDGNTSIMKAVKTESSWSISTSVKAAKGINSIAACEENEQLSIYYSCDTDGDFLTSADCEVFKFDINGIIQITDNEVMDAYVVSHNGKIYWNQDNSVTDGNVLVECDRLNGEFNVIGGDNPIIIYTSYDNAGNEYYNACYYDGSNWGTSIELAATQNLIGGYTAVCIDGNLKIISNEIGNDNNIANLIMQSFSNESNLEITDAYYEMHSLIAGDTLRIYADIFNNSADTISNYTVYAYANDSLLGQCDFSDNILSGESIEKLLLIPLPSEITFDQISLFAVSNGEVVDLNKSDFILEIKTQDVSVENATIVSEKNESDKIYVSIVNRGLNDLVGLTVSLRKDSSSGEILEQKILDGLALKSEELLCFDLGETVAEGTGFYITVDALEKENILSNNSVLVIKEYSNRDVIIESVIDQYPKIILDKKATVVIDENNKIQYFVFTPENDGYYAFYSNSDRDTYGRIYDIGMNQLVSDDDSGDGSNFKIKYMLTAGESYILEARYYYESNTGNFDVCVEKSKFITSLEVLSLPNRTEYIKDFVFGYLDYEGLKIKATWSDGTISYWEASSGEYYIEDEEVHINDYSASDTGIIYISCGDKETSYTLNLIENPVESISIDSPPVREYVYGDTEYGYLYSDGSYELYPTDLTGLSFTVYYTDGTNEIFTYNDIDENNNINGYSYNLYYDEYNPEIGNFPVTFEYMGKSADYTVILKESTVTSIAVTRKPIKTEYTNDYLPDFVGMELTITYTDETSKVVTLKEDNLIYEYNWGELCYKVEVDGYTLTIEPYYGEDMYYVAHYLGAKCDINDITFTNGKEIDSIELGNVSSNGDGMSVKLTYADETTDTLTLDMVAFSDYGDLSGSGYAQTKNGLLYYYIETYTDENGKVNEYRVYIFNEEITVEADEVVIGDVNSDGAVDNLDRLAITRYLADWDGYAEADINMAAADVNNDGSVDNLDRLALTRHLANWEDYETLPVN